MSDPEPGPNFDSSDDVTIMDEVKPRFTDNSDPETNSTTAVVTSTTNHSSEEDTATQNSTDKLLPTENPQTVSEVPDRLVLDGGRIDDRGVAVDPTGCLSPTSYSTFKEFLNHTPDLNLPWQSMRSVSQCGCGMPFSYSRRKVRASF